MADIFNSRAGYVAILPSDSVIPGRITVAGFSPSAALVSGIDYKQRTNQQFQTSLDRAIYLYVFGDLMGDVLVKGIAFPATCEGASEGLLEILKFYQNQRASVQSSPVNVQVGSSETIAGFLTAVEVISEAVAQDPMSFISNYTMTINALPKR
jgi:hypothetical protein